MSFMLLKNRCRRLSAPPPITITLGPYWWLFCAASFVEGAGVGVVVVSDAVVVVVEDSELGVVVELGGSVDGSFMSFTNIVWYCSK